MPMFHAFNNVAVLPTLRSGGQVITLPKFEPTTFIEALIQYRVFALIFFVLVVNSIYFKKLYFNDNVL